MAIPYSMKEMRRQLYSAVVCDALDSMGFRQQSPSTAIRPFTCRNSVLVGRCKTTLWEDIGHSDPHPYELELQAVDECQPDDVFIAAAAGSCRSGIWGELLTTAAMNRGCVGAIVDGAVRDIGKIGVLNFPVHAIGTCVYDSQDRQRVVEVDVQVEIGGVKISAGDLVVADQDGIVVVPHTIEEEAVVAAFAKIDGENQTRDAIKQGMKATEAYRKFGVL